MFIMSYNPTCALSQGKVGYAQSHTEVHVSALHLLSLPLIKLSVLLSTFLKM